jgi:hypothetical protein
MKIRTRKILAAALVATATVSVPARPAAAWVAFGGRYGCARVVAVHPAPCYPGVGVAAVAGFAAGAAVASAARPAVVVAPAPVVVVPPPVYVAPMIGTSTTVLPPGAHVMNVNGVQYYQLGATWYRPYFGGNGVYYTVVSPP